MLKDTIAKFSDKVIIEPVKMTIWKLPRMTTVYDINILFKKEDPTESYKGIHTDNYYKTENREEQQIKEQTVLIKQKQNLEELVGYKLFTIQEIENSFKDCVVKDIPVKIIFLGDELIAIASLDEKKFLLTEDISKPVISKKEFDNYIQELLSSKIDYIIKDFTSDVIAFKEFFSHHGKFSDNYYDLLTNLTKISHILNDI